MIIFTNDHNINIIINIIKYGFASCSEEWRTLNTVYRSLVVPLVDVIFLSIRFRTKQRMNWFYSGPSVYFYLLLYSIFPQTNKTRFLSVSMTTTLDFLPQHGWYDLWIILIYLGSRRDNIKAFNGERNILRDYSFNLYSYLFSLWTVT